MNKKRREFIQKTGIIAASTAFTPNILLSATRAKKEKLGVALVGLGYYSSQLLAPALKLTKNCELTGIVTGSPEKIPIWQEKYNIKDKNLIAINCGANVNFDRLRHIAERANYSEAREALFAVSIPEKAGSFKVFCKTLGKRNVTEFNYRYSNEKEAQIFVGVALTGRDNERLEIIRLLNENNYAVEDLTDNDMAKLHTRHLVGGHLNGNQSELVYRFEFPERPGALMGFLNKMGNRWNISLFHYRNHGSAFGRVLCGFQVPNNEKTVFLKFLDTIGYRYIEETNNGAYRKFLN